MSSERGHLNFMLTWEINLGEIQMTFNNLDSIALRNYCMVQEPIVSAF